MHGFRRLPVLEFAAMASQPDYLNSIFALAISYAVVFPTSRYLARHPDRWLITLGVLWMLLFAKLVWDIGTDWPAVRWPSRLVFAIAVIAGAFRGDRLRRHPPEEPPPELRRPLGE